MNARHKRAPRARFVVCGRVKQTRLVVIHEPNTVTLVQDNAE